MSTLLLPRSDVSRHLDALLLLSELREAFGQPRDAAAKVSTRTDVELRHEAVARVQLPGLHEGIPAYCLTFNPRIGADRADARSHVELFDLERGNLLAIIDAEQLVGLREAVVSALAVQVLAREDAATVAILGSGLRARLHLRCLRMVRTLKLAHVFDPSIVDANAFATTMYQALSLPVHAEESVEEAVAEADLIIALGSETAPYLHREMIRPGTHVTMVTPSLPSLQSLDETVLRDRAIVVAESAEAGRLFPLSSAGHTVADVMRAELGDLIAHGASVRANPRDVTVFVNAGLPFEDLIAAWHVYAGAREDPDLTRIDFGR